MHISSKNQEGCFLICRMHAPTLLPILRPLTYVRRATCGCPYICRLYSYLQLDWACSDSSVNTL